MENDSIINNAGTAVDEYNEKALAEEAVLNTLEKKLIEFSNGGGTVENPTMTVPGEDGSVASILPADQWNSITVTQINQGIVVVDHAITYDNGQSTGTVPDFNEYVWVPITGSEDNIFDRKPWRTPYYGFDSNGNWVSGTVLPQTLENTSTENAYWEATHGFRFSFYL